MYVKREGKSEVSHILEKFVLSKQFLLEIFMCCFKTNGRLFSKFLFECELINFPLFFLYNGL